MKNKKLRKIVKDLSDELQALSDAAGINGDDLFYVGIANGKRTAYGNARKLLEMAFAETFDKRLCLPGCVLIFPTREAEIGETVKLYGNGIIPCANDDPDAIGAVVSREELTATVFLEKPILI